MGKEIKRRPPGSGILSKRGIASLMEPSEGEARDSAKDARRTKPPRGLGILSARGMRQIMEDRYVPPPVDEAAVTQRLKRDQIPSQFPPLVRFSPKPDSAQREADELSPAAQSLLTAVNGQLSSKKHEFMGPVIVAKELSHYWRGKARSLKGDASAMAADFEKLMKEAEVSLMSGLKSLETSSRIESLIDQIDVDHLHEGTHVMHAVELNVVRALHRLVRASLYRQLSRRGRDDIIDPASLERASTEAANALIGLDLAKVPDDSGVVKFAHAIELSVDQELEQHRRDKSEPAILLRRKTPSSTEWPPTPPQPAPPPRAAEAITPKPPVEAHPVPPLRPTEVERAAREKAGWKPARGFPSAEKLAEWEFPFRAFVDGDMPTSFPHDLMFDAECLFFRGLAEALEKKYLFSFGGTYSFPDKQQAEENAARLNWSPERVDHFLNMVIQNLAASRLMRFREKYEDIAYRWPSDHLNRLERMLHFMHDLGGMSLDPSMSSQRASEPMLDPREPVQSALDEAAEDWRAKKKLIGGPPLRNISLGRLIKWILGGINGGIDTWDALEVVYNASWGEKEYVEFQAVLELPVDYPWGEREVMRYPLVKGRDSTQRELGSSIAEQAFMRALKGEKGLAALTYSVLAETALFYEEAEKGYYADIYEADARRQSAIRHITEGLFAGESSHDLPAVRRRRSDRRASSSLAGTSAMKGKLQPKSNKVKQQKIWVEPFHELRRAAYGLVASNLFSESGDAMWDVDPASALIAYELARTTLQVAYARFNLSLNYTSEDFGVSARELIIPLMFVAEDMMTNIKRNADLLASRVPPGGSDESSPPPATAPGGPGGQGVVQEPTSGNGAKAFLNQRVINPAHGLIFEGFQVFTPMGGLAPIMR